MYVPVAHDYAEFCALIPVARQPNVVLSDGFDARTEITVDEMPRTPLLAQIIDGDTSRILLCGTDNTIDLTMAIQPENKLAGARMVRGEYVGKPGIGVRFFTVMTLAERVMVERMARAGGIFMPGVIRMWLALDAIRQRGREISFAAVCQWADHQLGRTIKKEDLPWEQMRFAGERFYVGTMYSNLAHASMKSAYNAGVRDVWEWWLTVNDDTDVKISAEMLLRCMKDMGLTPKGE